MSSREVEESFEGTIEAVDSEGVQLRTRSSSGEEGTAFLPYANIPPSERRHVEIGAPVRISIVRSAGKRSWCVRILSPSQWKPSPEKREQVVSSLMKKIESIWSRE
jgi:hypothetical protein